MQLTGLSKFFKKEKESETKTIEKVLEEEEKIISLSPIEEKRQLKQQAKDNIKKKFKVGDIYYLRNKSVISGTTSNVREFEIKKVIYTINTQIVNSLVVKELSPINTSIFTLNKYDCKKLHIKYENGLQVFPMDMIWVRKNDLYE